jgi:hypothetical protein
VPDIVGISTSTCSGPVRNNISAAVSEATAPGKIMEFSKTAGAKVLVIVGSRSVSPFDGTYWEDVMQHMVQIFGSPANSLFLHQLGLDYTRCLRHLLSLSNLK